MAVLASISVAAKDDDLKKFVEDVRRRSLGDSQARSMDDLGILVLQRME
jgi:hypothetical protein